MTEMKDLGKELFFFAWLKRGTDEDFSRPLTSPSVTLSPTSPRGEKWDLNGDGPEGGPAGSKSPGRGDCFSSGTGWLGGKGYTEGGGKKDQHASAAGSTQHVSCRVSTLCPHSRQHGHLCLRQTLCSGLRGEIRRRYQSSKLSSLLLSSLSGCAVLQVVTAWISHLFSHLEEAVWIWISR